MKESEDNNDFKEIEEISKDLEPNQRRCPKCKEVVTSYHNLVYCSCGYLGVDAGSMLPDGSLVRILIPSSKNITARQK